jgi:hypothetical protein
MLFRRLLEKLAGVSAVDTVMKRLESEVAKDADKDRVWRIGFTKARWISRGG